MMIRLAASSLPILLLLALALSGCGTGPINLNIPMNRLDSPEAIGKSLGGAVSGGFRATDQVTLTPDYGSVAVPTVNPRLGSYSDIGMQGTLGIIERLDGSLKFDGSGPLVLEAKYQLLGDTSLEAQPGNFSLSIVAGGGWTSKSDSGSSPTLQPASYNANWSIYEAGATVGYRFSPTLLGYGGYTWTHLSFNGSQTMFSSAVVNWSGSGTQQLAHLGLMARVPLKDRHDDHERGHLFAQLEGSLAFFRVGPAESTDPNGAINVGFQW